MTAKELIKDVEIAEIESAKRIRIFTEAGDGINNTTYPTLDAAVGVVRAIYGADCHEAVTLGIITNDTGDDVATYVEEVNSTKKLRDKCPDCASETGRA